MMNDAWGLVMAGLVTGFSGWMMYWGGPRDRDVSAPLLIIGLLVGGWFLRGVLG